MVQFDVLGEKVVIARIMIHLCSMKTKKKKLIHHQSSHPMGNVYPHLYQVIFCIISAYIFYKIKHMREILSYKSFLGTLHCAHHKCDDIKSFIYNRKLIHWFCHLTARPTALDTTNSPSFIANFGSESFEPIKSPPSKASNEDSNAISTTAASLQAKLAGIDRKIERKSDSLRQKTISPNTGSSLREGEYFGGRGGPRRPTLNAESYSDKSASTEKTALSDLMSTR